MGYEVGDLVVYTYQSGSIYYGVITHIAEDSPQWFTVIWNDGSHSMEHIHYAWIKNITKAY
jgi:hypothetical protein